MFEEDLLDEEVKKKKRRVLVLLFILLLLGTMVLFPLAELFPPFSTAVSEAVVGTPAYTDTAPRPTLVPAAGTATGVPTPSVEATTTTPPGATPQWTATAAVACVTPIVTEEAPGGAGGGMPGFSPTATSTPAGTSPVLVTPTPPEPGELPVTGADGSRGLGWLILGLVATLLGALMLGAGYALRNTKPVRR